MGKWNKWEYWPTYMFYIPILPYYVYLAARARHPVFFSAANPGILAGGSGFESKYKTIQLVPEKWRPMSIFISNTDSIKSILETIEKTNIAYPFIIKPDVGFRGLLVKKIKHQKDLEEYIASNELDLIIQEFIPGEVEYGIFYHRVPGTDKGKITSLTQKVYMQVTGDGELSVLDLMKDAAIEDRFIELVRINQDEGFLAFIPENGEKLILSHIGNHSKGTTFLNANDQISEKLEQRMDSISKEINGWYYGRLDVKLDSMDALLKGESIKILEINGVFGEPTHIWDSNVMSYTKAMKEILRHWKFLYNVSIAARKEGAKYFGTFSMLGEIVKLIRYKARLERLSS